VFVDCVQIVVDRFGTYRTMVSLNYLSLWLHMEIKIIKFCSESKFFLYEKKDLFKLMSFDHGN